MCEFCEKHGHGNRWYLNPDNYSDEMMADRERQKLVEEICGHGIDYYINFSSTSARSGICRGACSPTVRWKR